MGPRKFWSSAWNAGPPSWLQPKHAQQYSTYEQNRTQQFTTKAKRAYVVCGDPGCSGWLYVGNGETKCRSCGCDIDGPCENGTGAPARSWAAADKVDGAAFDALAAGDPIRQTLQQLIDAGKATLDRKVAGDPFVDLKVRVGICSREMVKAQGILNHHRNTLRQCRERIGKLEEMVLESEKDVKTKMDESVECNANFEKMVSERNLKSNWAAAAEPPAAAGTAPAKVIERNAQLEAELLDMQATMRRMAMQLHALQHGHGLAAAGSAAGAPAAAGAGSGGAAPTAPTAAALAGERAAAEAFTGQPLLELVDKVEPPVQGSKRFRAGVDTTAGETLVDASMGLAEVPGGNLDPIEEYPPTQEASAAKVLADAMAAAESAAAALRQQG
jgi:hypothetical protein